MTERNEELTVELKHRSYQPSKAGLEENVKIETTPERLAQSLLRQVNVRECT